MKENQRRIEAGKVMVKGNAVGKYFPEYFIRDPVNRGYGIATGVYL